MRIAFFGAVLAFVANAVNLDQATDSTENAQVANNFAEVGGRCGVRTGKNQAMRTSGKTAKSDLLTIPTSSSHACYKRCIFDYPEANYYNFNFKSKVCRCHYLYESDTASSNWYTSANNVG